MIPLPDLPSPRDAFTAWAKEMAAAVRKARSPQMIEELLADNAKLMDRLQRRYPDLSDRLTAIVNQTTVEFARA